MNCPHCGHEMLCTHALSDGDLYACECDLAAPRDVLEALAARLAPAGTLAEAERLLRARDVHMVALRENGTVIGGVTLWTLTGRKLRSRGTLADAVARLEKEGER